jgi:rSAM/selenodomain-associated transferase 1
MRAVLIMAKAPRAGAVKTRLEPLLGAEGCARLQRELVRHTAGWVKRATGKASLAFTPADARDELAALVPPGVRLFPQQGGDLGERLRSATDRVFASHGAPLVVIGTDAPELAAAHLWFAERELRAGRGACLVPTLDGGYALIALARTVPGAFELPRAAWGGPDVLSLTLSALDAAGCAWALLEQVRDLDTPDDARHVAADPRCPPAVRAVLRGDADA